MTFVPTICNRCGQKREKTPAGTKHGGPGACGGIFVTRIETSVSSTGNQRLDSKMAGRRGLIEK